MKLLHDAEWSGGAHERHRSCPCRPTYEDDGDPEHDVHLIYVTVLGGYVELAH